MFTAVKDFATSKWQYITDTISAAVREGRVHAQGWPRLFQAASLFVKHKHLLSCCWNWGTGFKWILFVSIHVHKVNFNNKRWYEKDMMPPWRRHLVDVTLTSPPPQWQCWIYILAPLLGFYVRDRDLHSVVLLSWQMLLPLCEHPSPMASIHVIHGNYLGYNLTFFIFICTIKIVGIQGRLRGEEHLLFLQKI